MAGTGEIALIGGNVALDFANTAGWHASDAQAEWLTDYHELIAWARHVKAIAPSSSEVLLRAATANPRGATRALRAALTLREADYRVFTAVAQGRAPAEEDVARLHAAHVAALGAAEPHWHQKTGFTLRWRHDASDLTSPLHPVMIRAAELLASPDLARLRQCARHPCGWLFLDRSRNGSRRWCSSAECGNATRVIRFRERQG